MNLLESVFYVLISDLFIFFRLVRYTNNYSRYNARILGKINIIENVKISAHRNKLHVCYSLACQFISTYLSLNNSLHT